MATLHINLEKIISQKIEEKIDEMLNKAFSNISIDSYEDLPDEEYEETDSCKIEEKIEKDDDFKSRDELSGDPFDDFERGWVARLNAYKYVIDEMKKQLTEEQIKQIETPCSTNIKEYAFQRYIQGLTWEELHNLFQNNKYLNLNIISEDLNKSQLECYGTTPTDIYYNLLKEIIKDNVEKVYQLKYTDDSILQSLIIKELRKDFDSKCLEFVNDIIDKYHIELFDEIFGDKWYLNSERNADLYLKNIFKNKINNENEEEYDEEQ